SRQKSSLAKNLETVADAEDEAARACEFFDRAHHRGKPCNRAGTQIVAVGKATRQNNRVKTGNLFGLMPEEFDGLVEDLAKRVVGVVVAIRSRKHDHTKSHRAESPLAAILSQRPMIFLGPVE